MKSFHPLCLCTMHKNTRNNRHVLLNIACSASVLQASFARFNLSTHSLYCRKISTLIAIIAFLERFKSVWPNATSCRSFCHEILWVDTVKVSAVITEWVRLKTPNTFSSQRQKHLVTFTQCTERKPPNRKPKQGWKMKTWVRELKSLKTRC